MNLFIPGVILAAATAYGQSARPGLSDVVPISDPVAGEILVTSPDHQVFASRFSFCGEFVQIPSFSFTVFRVDGQIQSRGEGLRIHGQFAAVSNRGELWVVGTQCSEGQTPCQDPHLRGTCVAGRAELGSARDCRGWNWERHRDGRRGRIGRS